MLGVNLGLGEGAGKEGLARTGGGELTNNINSDASHSFYVAEVNTEEMEQLINRFLAEKFSQGDTVKRGYVKSY